MIKAVIFDWGGVLMRTEDVRPRHRWDARLGLAPGSVEGVVHGIDQWRQAQLGDISLEEYWQAVGAALQLDEPALAALRREFYSDDRLDHTLVALIKDLRDQGLRVGMLSNNTPDLIDTIVALGLDDLFDAVVVSARIGVMKPEAAAFRAILQRLEVEAGEAVLVDDFSANVAGARRAGLNAILFSADNHWRTELAALLEK